MSDVLTLRLSDAKRVRELTGFSPGQMRRLAMTSGFPLRSIGTGKGRREWVVVSEFLAWFAARSERVA